MKRWDLRNHNKNQAWQSNPGFYLFIIRHWLILELLACKSNGVITKSSPISGQWIPSPEGRILKLSL